MNVEDRAAVTIDKKRDFDRLEGVFDAFRVIMARLVLGETRRVNRWDIAAVVNRRGQS
jgi:hypothetical protein